LANGEVKLTEEDVTASDTDDDIEMRALVSEEEMQKVAKCYIFTQ